MSPGVSSGVLPRLQRHSRLCCRRGTRCLPAPGQLRVPGNAGVFCPIHLREVSMCACSKKDGSAFLAKRTQPGLTRAREKKHSFTSDGTCVLRRFVQRSAGWSPPTPSPAPSPAPPPAPSPACRQQRLLLHSRCPPAQQRVLRLWPP